MNASVEVSLKIFWGVVLFCSNCLIFANDYKVFGALKITPSIYSNVLATDALSSQETYYSARSIFAPAVGSQWSLLFLPEIESSNYGFGISYLSDASIELVEQKYDYVTDSIRFYQNNLYYKMTAYEFDLITPIRSRWFLSVGPFFGRIQGTHSLPIRINTEGLADKKDFPTRALAYLLPLDEHFEPSLDENILGLDQLNQVYQHDHSFFYSAVDSNLAGWYCWGLGFSLDQPLIEVSSLSFSVGVYGRAARLSYGMDFFSSTSIMLSELAGTSNSAYPIKLDKFFTFGVSINILSQM